MMAGRWFRGRVSLSVENGWSMDGTGGRGALHSFVVAVLVVVSSVVVGAHAGRALAPATAPPACTAHPAPTYSAETGRQTGPPSWPDPDTRVCLEHDASLGTVSSSPSIVKLGDSVTLSVAGPSFCNPSDFTQVGCLAVVGWSQAPRWFDVDTQTMTPDTSVRPQSPCDSKRSLSCVVKPRSTDGPGVR